MFDTIRDIWKIKDLRNRILYTLMMLALVRLGCLIPSPLVDGATMTSWFRSAGDLMELFNLMSGSAFSQLNLFAMGIQPYINASIIMSLLCVAIPALEEIQKDGESGQKKINQYTRYITIGLALIQSFGIAYSMSSYGFISDSLGKWWGIILSMIIFVAGSMFVMWIGEQITEKGIGNGISLIIMINILSNIPTALQNLFAIEKVWVIVLVLVVMLLMIVFVTVLELAERRIPVQYAKRIQGRKTYGGSSSYIPIRVNMAGVIPIIFASSIQSMPQLITAFVTSEPKGWWGTVIEWLKTSHPFGAVLYVVLIVLFTYFYASITFNPIDMSENLKKNGGYIPGFRPGKPTTEYLQKSAKYVTTIGAIALAIIAALPVILQISFKLNTLVITGSSLMIIVGVALETVKQIEGQMVMRRYKGFLSR